MFERLSNTTRMALAYANQEAQRLNHGTLASEHILLGLLREGAGNAIELLRSLGVEELQIRSHLEESMVCIPDLDQPGRFRRSLSAKKVIEHAIEQARSLGHNYVGTEHLLLGLLLDEASPAAETLAALGLNFVDARQELSEMMERGEHEREG